MTCELPTSLRGMGDDTVTRDIDGLRVTITHATGTVPIVPGPDLLAAAQRWHRTVRELAVTCRAVQRLAVFALGPMGPTLRPERSHARARPHTQARARRRQRTRQKRAATRRSRTEDAGDPEPHRKLVTALTLRAAA